MLSVASLFFQEHFSQFSYALMTMYVMTLGELNYHEDFLPWNELAFPTLTNVLFIVLVLGMPIIMMNMLVSSVENKCRENDVADLVFNFLFEITNIFTIFEKEKQNLKLGFRAMLFFFYKPKVVLNSN